jgi:beta-glucosidase
VNKELNASDAFVAAWLPGSEGQGVADVLLTNSAGAIQYDFHGKLSFSWPKFDDQYLLNVGQAQYEPLFAYGYGLTYAGKTELAPLSEATRAQPLQATAQQTPLFVRNLAEGMLWALSDNSAVLKSFNTPSAVSADGHSITMQSVNLAYQEDGRKFVWQGADNSASASLIYAGAQLVPQDIRSKSLQLSIRLDSASMKNAGEKALKIAAMCQQQNCLRTVSLKPVLHNMTAGKWYNIALPLHCEGEAGPVNLVQEAVRFTAAQPFSLAVADIALVNTVASSTILLECAQQ